MAPRHAIPDNDEPHGTGKASTLHSSKMIRYSWSPFNPSNRDGYYRGEKP